MFSMPSQPQFSLFYSLIFPNFASVFTKLCRHGEHVLFLNLKSWVQKKDNRNQKNCFSPMLSRSVQVNRSTALLRSLSVERQRWEAGSNAFQTQMGTIIGDVLLTSAFLSYGGEWYYVCVIHIQRYLCSFKIDYFRDT